MVSLISVVTKIAVVTLSFAGSVYSQQDISYFRPTGDQVSGFVNAKTPYVRSPCPALNSLANHGILPRNGYNITRAQYKQAIMLVFEFTDSMANQLTNRLPDRSNLNFLSTHNFIEHDASLASTDSSVGHDPSQVSVELVNDVVGRAKNGILTLPNVVDTLRARRNSCFKKWWPRCEFGPQQLQIALGEVATLLNVLGRNEQISVVHFKSFFEENRVPSDWIPPTSKVDERLLGSTQFKAQALLGFR